MVDQVPEAALPVYREVDVTAIETVPAVDIRGGNLTVTMTQIIIVP